MRALLDMEHEFLSSTDRHVLLALRVRVGDNGRCWPTQRRISRDTGLAERTIRECTAKLERLGLIKAAKAENNGRQKVYKITGVERRASAANNGRKASERNVNTGKSRQNTGTGRPQTPAPDAARMNKRNEKEGNSSGPGHADARHLPHSEAMRTCEPQQFRELINWLGSGLSSAREAQATMGTAGQLRSSQ